MVEVLKGDIVLVPFPFSDLGGSKRRPALVISNDRFNKKSQDIVLLAITSNITDSKNSIMIRNSDWKNGMYSESCVKVHAIHCIEKKLIIKKIGTLSTKRLKEVMAKLFEIIS